MDLLRARFMKTPFEEEFQKKRKKNTSGITATTFRFFRYKPGI